MLNAKSVTGCVYIEICCYLACFYRAETPPTLGDYDRRWSFKSGTENISVTVNPSRFTGQINGFSFQFCSFVNSYSDVMLSRVKYLHFVFCHNFLHVFICPIAIAYSMGQIIKLVCVCVSVCLCVSVRLWALSRSHFLIDFHKNWHRRKNPEK